MDSLDGLPRVTRLLLLGATAILIGGVVAATVVAVVGDATPFAVANPRRPGDRDDSISMGSIVLPIDVDYECVSDACLFRVDTVPRINVDMGHPVRRRVMCLDASPSGQTPAAPQLAVYRPLERISDTFQPPPLSSDLVYLSGARFRLPVVSAPGEAGTQSPVCEGHISLARGAGLSQFYSNFTRAPNRLWVGGTPRSAGKQVEFESPPLVQADRRPDEENAAAVLPGSINGTSYRIVFDSGSQYTELPEPLYAALALADDNDDLVIRFPPEGQEPSELACIEGYRALGFKHVSECPGTSFELRLPLSVMGRAVSGNGAEESTLVPGPSADTVYLGNKAWLFAVMHVNNGMEMAVLRSSSPTGALGTTGVVLAAILVILLLMLSVKQQPLPWVVSVKMRGRQAVDGNSRIVLADLLRLGLELSTFIIGWTLPLSPSTQPTFSESPARSPVVLTALYGIAGLAAGGYWLVVTARLIYSRFSRGARWKTYLRGPDARPRWQGQPGPLLQNESVRLAFDASVQIALLTVLVALSQTNGGSPVGEVHNFWSFAATLLLLFNVVLHSLYRIYYEVIRWGVPDSSPVTRWQAFSRVVALLVTAAVFVTATVALGFLIDDTAYPYVEERLDLQRVLVRMSFWLLVVVLGAAAVIYSERYLLWLGNQIGGDGQGESKPKEE